MVKWGIPNLGIVFRGERYYLTNYQLPIYWDFFKLLANYRYQKMCIQFHLINWIENTVPKTRKRVFHIPDEYEIHYENIAKSCTAIRAENLGSKNMFTPPIVITFLSKNLIFGEFMGKVIKSRYMGHFLVIGHIINID